MRKGGIAITFCYLRVYNTCVCLSRNRLQNGAKRELPGTWPAHPPQKKEKQEEQRGVMDTLPQTDRVTD